MLNCDRSVDLPPLQIYPTLLEEGRYLCSVSIKWTDLYVAQFDQPRVESAGPPDLYVGPPRQLGGALIEVMVERVPPHDVVIFHVMTARQKFLDLLDDGE